MNIDIDSALTAAVAALLWTTPNWDVAGQGGLLGNLDDDHDESDMHPDALAELKSDLEAFITEHAETIDATGMDSGQLGYDFILTRDRHGAGFWDRGYGDDGDTLTEAAHAYGATSAYVGDDGKVHLQ